MKPITKDMGIEELIELLPEALTVLVAKGICGIRCGEKISGSIYEVAREKGFSDLEVDKIVFALNGMIK